MNRVCLSENRQRCIVELLQNLIRIESYSGKERALADFIENQMYKLGFDRVWRDRCGNIIGFMAGHANEHKKLLFDAHMDTVGISDTWSRLPFEGQIEQELIYGRGTTDTKGAMAAALTGVAYAKEDGKLFWDVFISCSVGEEFHEGVALKEIMDSINPDAVVICEPSNLKVNIGQRGRAEVVVEVIGKSAHAASPQVGINALKHMAQIINAIGQLDVPEDAFMGRQIIEPTECITAPYPGISIVPYSCKTRWDMRLLLGQTEHDVLQEINEVLHKLQHALPDLRGVAKIEEATFQCYTGHMLSGKKFLPAWKTIDSHPLVKQALSACVKAGITPSTGCYSFCTNGSYSAGVALVPTIGFGPGREENAHIDDEYLEIPQLFKACEFYYYLTQQGF